MAELNQEVKRGSGRMRAKGLVKQSRGRRFRGQGSAGVCVCPDCGYEEKHQRGNPCYQKKCPECGAGLIRK